MNVTAGIGILAQASPLIQESFPGRVTPATAAGFVGLLSLFNLVGRFFWSSLSDQIGRTPTYAIYLGAGMLLYALVPSLGRAGNLVLFVGTFCVILSMYGGGFATIPAYLRDMFGSIQIGAIHGRLLTAWSVAGIAGPTIVTYIRDYQLGHGVAKADAYSAAIYIMVGVLAVGFFCNLAVRPVNPRYHVPSVEVALAGAAVGSLVTIEPAPSGDRHRTSRVRIAAAWVTVAVPLLWGVYQTVIKSLALFG
jgi:hypothetical protein